MISQTDADKEFLQKLLQALTYKPGWRFSIRDKMLMIDAIVIDADNHNKEIRLTFAQGIPSFVHPEFPWDRWLLDQIMEVERHEAQEFFKIDGVKVFDPHA